MTTADQTRQAFRERLQAVTTPATLPTTERSIDLLARALSDYLRDEAVSEADRNGVRLAVSCILRLAKGGSR